MNKLMSVLMPIKSLAALIFAGLIVLYMVAGAIVPAVIHQPFNFTIPFIFVIEGVVLSVLIAGLWGVFFGDQAVLQWRYFPKLIVFCLAMAALLTLSVLVFFGWHTDWAKLWWMVIACIMAGVVGVSIIGELYYRKTGRRYTQILQNYQAAHTPTSN
ncbi:MAG: hypothetical protein FWD80_03165 [Propionibacteriaceae bacterium]|nr:hypothetical protein [Propionibacteriaceae bacterium]